MPAWKNARLSALIAVSLIVLQPMPAAAKASTADDGGTTESALTDIERGGTEATLMKFLLWNFAQAFTWANAMNDHRGFEALYCTPPKLSLESDQISEIVKDYVAENPEVRDKPIGFTILVSLQDMFPCEAGPLKKNR